VLQGADRESGGGYDRRALITKKAGCDGQRIVPAGRVSPADDIAGPIEASVREGSAYSPSGAEAG
jgi:hypothetical protein